MHCVRLRLIANESKEGSRHVELYSNYFHLCIYFWIVGVQFILAYLIYKGVIKRYLEREEILLTALILITIIVEQAFNYQYPLQVGVFLHTALVEGTTQIGAVVV